MTSINGETRRLQEVDEEKWLQEKRLRKEVAIANETRYHVIRLQPGEDLMQSLWKYARISGIRAASILSAVGSLQKTNIRYASDDDGTVIEDRFEIVSLVGNIDHQSKTEYPSSMGMKEGSAHIHISISDRSGRTIGGHLLPGNIIFTTAEITLIEFLDVTFGRQFDAEENGGSGYYELQVTTDHL